jgi:arylsulfatase
MARVLRLLLSLALITGCAACQRAPEPQGPPNIVLITFCTMRADHLGAYGAPRGASPHLDRLAANGAVFLDHTTQASYTGGSFASLLTGRYGFAHGVWDHPQRLDDSLVTLAETMQAAGYATGGFVYSGYIGDKFNYDQGFDSFNELEGSAVTAPSRRSRNLHEKRLEQAMRWLQEHRDEPFLLWYETPVTHYPYVLPPEVVPDAARTAYRQHREREQRSPISRTMFDYASMGFTVQETEAALAHYRAAVTYADSLVGTLLAAVRDLGLEQRTVVVVVADHGDALGEHGIYFNHDANLYQPTLRVPFILSGPGVPRVRIDAVSRTIDLLPTLCTLTGVGLASPTDGVDLTPLLRGEPLDLTAFAESRPLTRSRGPHPHYHLQVPGVAGKLRTVRDGPHKLIEFPTPSGSRYELYDLVRDPGELHDLAASQPETVERLAGVLDSWFATYATADTAPLDLDDDDLASLQALGYVD